MHNAPHLGKSLREWMADDLTVSALASYLEVSRVALSKILNGSDGSDGITAVMAFKLAEAFSKTIPKLWMDLQTQYELSRARRDRGKHIAAVKAA